MAIRSITTAGFVGITLAAASGIAPAAQPQGLYSADRLMDADVYSQGNPQQQVGEVKDVLFGNDMSIKSFVVQTENKYGLNGKSYVVQPNQIRVQTTQGGDTSSPRYRVILKTGKQQLSSYPVYSNAWWHKAQKRASSAWQQTKHSATSAWTQLKNTTSNLVNDTRHKANNAADSAGDAANNAADDAKNATQ